MKAKRHNATEPGAAPRRAGPPAGGFTLIELLTIIVILGMLITMTTPSILKAREMFKTEQTYGILKDLGGAIRLYNQDWGEDPPSAGGVTGGLKGRYALVQALLGYRDDDGKRGRGARRPNAKRGKDLGPYTEAKVDGKPPAFVDAFGNQIYYYRYGERTAGKYNSVDNDRGPSDLEQYLKDPNSNYYRKDYVLITPGPDREWMKPGENPDPNKPKKTDDIANFSFKFKKLGVKP